MYSAYVREFEDLSADSFAQYLKLSNEIGGLVQKQAQLVKQALGAQQQFIELASRSQKPNNLDSLLKPTAILMNEVISIRDKNRKDENFNHLSAVAEGIPALGWVQISPTPGPFVKDFTEAAQFYTNKVLVAFKDKNTKHIDWAQSWIEFLNQLQKYVRKNHTTGLVWNKSGTFDNGNSLPAGDNAAGGPPPPPPPPSADFFENVSQPSKTSSVDDRAALFAQINKGVDIVQGLRKISPFDKAQKNSDIQKSNKVPERSTKNSKSLTGAQIKKPKFELEGKKWLVENQIGGANLTIDDTNMTQSINIYNCQDSMVTVKGKVNSITVNRCKKFNLVFDNIVSVVEFIDSQRIKTQATGIVPTITLDKVDGIEIYLGKPSLSAEIVSSKCSEINISIVNDNGDSQEHPIPEQLKSIWNGKRFETIALEKF